MREQSEREDDEDGREYISLITMDSEILMRESVRESAACVAFFAPK